MCEVCCDPPVADDDDVTSLLFVEADGVALSTPRRSSTFPVDGFRARSVTIGSSNRGGCSSPSSTSADGGGGGRAPPFDPRVTTPGCCGIWSARMMLLRRRPRRGPCSSSFAVRRCALTPAVERCSNELSAAAVGDMEASSVGGGAAGRDARRLESLRLLLAESRRMLPAPPPVPLGRT